MVETKAPPLDLSRPQKYVTLGTHAEAVARYRPDLLQAGPPVGDGARRSYTCEGHLATLTKPGGTVVFCQRCEQELPWYPLPAAGGRT
jgi:hypothetical protein